MENFTRNRRQTRRVTVYREDFFFKGKSRGRLEGIGGQGLYGGFGLNLISGMTVAEVRRLKIVIPIVYRIYIGMRIKVNLSK